MKKIITVIVIIMAASYLFWANSSIVITDITVKSDHLPSSFNGFKIVHISDLHNTEFGDDNRNLLSLIRKAGPDIIAVTGDIIDSRRTDADIAEDFIEDALMIAPVYYSTGNHESRIKQYEKMEREFVENGAYILRNDRSYIEKNGEKILIMGIDDPDFNNKPVSEALDILKEENTFTILLSHRPELFDIYTEKGIDLTLSGHAHGGQFRLPFIGGLYAPHQGFMPKYTSGLYTEGSSNMIVSRGLGNSLFPLRLFNRPEIVVITLENK